MITLPPTSASVPCAGAEHVLQWRDGRLVAADHPDADRERALTALGGDAYPCLQLLDAWRAHVDDLDVLVLGPRGPQDRFAPVGDVHQHGPHGLPGVRYRGSYAPLTSAGVSWRPMSSNPTVTSLGPAAGPSAGVTLRDVLRLGGGLPQRLAAQVVDTWSALLAADDDRAASARPRLHAALHGRFAPVVRAWLGEPRLRVGVVMVAAGSSVVLERTDAGLQAELPFAWLADVWSPGLGVLADRLCVAARQPDPGRYELDTVGRDLADRTTATLEIARPGA